MAVSTKTLYIPLEIFDREMGGGLLLACEALGRGWQVVLGGKQAIFNNLSRFRKIPGVFFLKSIVPGETFIQNKLKRYGHKITSLDIEGLVPSVGEAGVRLRYSKESVDLTDIIYFWGVKHYKSVFDIYPGIENKSVISGSPIIDEILIRGKDRENTQRIKKKILIGTSCGYANHINGIEFSKRMSRNAYSNNLSNEEQIEIVNEAFLDIKIFEYWQHIVPILSTRFKHFDIVLRPHPSENKDFWIDYTKELTNVTVRQVGSILNEMMDADIYLHYNSTSAVTSHLLNILTIMINPDISEELATRVTYVKKLSAPIKSDDDIIFLINNLREGQYKNAQNENLDNFVQNLNNNSNSSKLIMDSIEKSIDFSNYIGVIKKRATKELIKFIIIRTRFTTQVYLNTLFKVLFDWENYNWIPSNGFRYSRLKQPKTPISEIRVYMSNLNLEDYHSRVTKITNNLFLFS